MADIVRVLRPEISGDPESLGYAGKTDLEVQDLLNSLATGRTRDVPTIRSAQVYEAITGTELDALTADDRAKVDRILSLGDDIIVAPGSKARACIVAVFGSETATRASLLEIITRTTSRATELGLPTIKLGHVQEARR